MTHNAAAWNTIASTHESTIPLDFAQLLTPMGTASALLEVGSGYGRVLAYLRESGWPNLTGIDVSVRMAQRALSAGFQRIAVSSATELPFPPNSFDCVVVIGTMSSLSYRTDRRIALAEFARVLRPRGLMLMRDFALTWSPYRLARYLFYWLRGYPPGNFVSAEGIEFHHFAVGEIERDISEARMRVVALTRERFVTMHGRPCGGVTILASRIPSDE